MPFELISFSTAKDLADDVARRSWSGTGATGNPRESDARAALRNLLGD